MDVRHLRLLRDLRDHGGVVAAAEATFRTPSAVSQQLRTAERDLGVRLVEPDGRGIRLTEAALLLADAAGQVEVALAEAQGRLDDFLGRAAGEVRVAALPSAAEYLLPPVLTALAEGPIRVVVEDVDVSEADFASLARDVDLVVGHSLSGEVPRGAEALHRTVLAREPIDVALPAGHRLAGGRRGLRADQLVHERWIAVPPGYPFGTVLDRVRRQTGAGLEIVQQVRDNRLVEALVAAGVGIALLPRYTTRPRPGLTLRPLVDVDAERWVVGMSRPDRARRAAVRELVERLARVGEDLRRRGRAAPS